MMARLKNDQGFSLVEMMVATLLFAMVSAAGVMILSAYQDGRLSLAEADTKLADIEVARALMAADLSAAVARPLRTAAGGTGPAFEASAQAPGGLLMAFVRSGNMGALIAGNSSSLDRTEYLLAGDQLVRRTYARPDITPETPAQDRTLLTGVRAVQARFDADGLWVAEWHGADLPRLAEITLTFDQGRSLTLTLLVGADA